MQQSPIKEAAKHHTDLNVFASLVAILEGGCVYTDSGRRMASKIVDLCHEEEQRQLRAYDKALAEGGTHD